MITKEKFERVKKFCPVVCGLVYNYDTITNLCTPHKWVCGLMCNYDNCPMIFWVNESEREGDN